MNSTPAECLRLVTCLPSAIYITSLTPAQREPIFFLPLAPAPLEWCTKILYISSSTRFTFPHPYRQHLTIRTRCNIKGETKDAPAADAPTRPKFQLARKNAKQTSSHTREPTSSRTSRYPHPYDTSVDFRDTSRAIKKSEVGVIEVIDHRVRIQIKWNWHRVSKIRLRAFLRFGK